MSQIIVTSRFLKAGSKDKNHSAGTTQNTCAIRETVRCVNRKKYDLNAATTKSRKIDELLSIFPKQKYLELGLQNKSHIGKCL